MKMIKNLFFAALVIGMAACNSENKDGGTMTTPSGYTYTKVSGNGAAGNPGDFVYFTLSIKGDNGKVLQEMGEGPNMPILQIPTTENPPQQPNPVLDVIENASVGDSLIMIMPIDSIPNGRNNPSLTGMDNIEYHMYVTDIKTEEGHREAQAAARLEMEAKMEQSKARIPEVEETVNGLLADYEAGKLDIEKTDEGLEYVMIEEGTGTQAEAGKTVSVQYYGTLMDGKMFDNSFRRGAPFEFTVGQGQVIKGWDLGLPKMKEGGKAALFIPYELAYGEAGSPPNIPAKSQLLFYVELEEVK